MMYRESEPSDVVPILHDLSDISRREMAKAEVPDNLLINLALDGIRTGKAFTIIDEDEKPIALFWFYPSLFEIETNFIAAEAFFAKPLPSIRIGQEIMSHATDDYPNASFVAYSMSDHVRLARWFGLLGFVEMPRRGPAKRFEFIPNWC